MKTLYLVRHAKSDWNNGELLDVDRPLNARGYRDAHFMSKLLKEKKLLPELIISSPAVRAISTALIFARNFNFKHSTIVIKDELYESSVNHYLQCITELDDKIKNVMIVGHNPLLTDLANTLTITVADMPTCSIAGIKKLDRGIAWKNFASSPAELVLFDFPKNYLK